MKRYKMIEDMKEGLKKLVDTVNEVLKDTYDEVLKSYTTSIKAGAKSFISKYESMGKSKKMTIPEWIDDKKDTSDSAFKAIQDFPIWEKCFTEEGEYKPEFPKVVKAVAKKMTDDLFNMYMDRMKDKMKNVVSNKDLKDIKLNGIKHSRGAIEAEFKFIFEKGEFYLRSQIVTVWNVANAFTRYPFTFHYAEFPDGKKVAKPSLAEIEQGFITEDTDFMKIKNQSNIIQQMGFYPPELYIKDLKYQLSMWQLSDLRSRGMDKQTIAKGTPYITYPNNKWIKTFKVIGGSGDRRIKKIEIEFKDGTKIIGSAWNYEPDGNIYGIVSEVISLGDNTKKIEISGYAKEVQDANAQVKINKDLRKKLKSQFYKATGIQDLNKLDAKADKIGEVPLEIKPGYPININFFNNSKWLNSLTFNPVPTEEQIKDFRYEFKNTNCIAEWADGTKLEFKVDRIADGHGLKPRAKIQKGKIKTNLSFTDLYHIKGKITKVIALGDLTKKLNESIGLQRYKRI